MLEVCSGVTNEKEKDGGTRGLVGLWSEGPRMTGAPLCVRACAQGSNLVVPLWCTSELDRSESTYLLGESASSFIDEEGGLTGERERVHLLLSLAAHAGGYKMMVGAHNTVEC